MEKHSNSKKAFNVKNSITGKMNKTGGGPVPSGKLDADPLASLGSKMPQQRQNFKVFGVGPVKCDGINKNGSQCGNVVLRNSRCRWHLLA